ncbi:hypothetical protein JG687_00010043 [Phytophthora cactorum]|uniref:YbaK/aminoacyl-tRNA synthetase-associated domain-containing protein n=2 Tax=Phytophthora cactorum TaxID=29920 RepID=A0A8T1U7X3_9STRA|nr:hypothetical protein JG687_00010043 [Phytophthora cactorum]
MTIIEEVTARLAAAQKRLDALERSLDDLEGVKRVKKHLQREKLVSAALKTAPSDYYAWTLAQRAKLLGCEVPHLCKSIIVENVACVNSGIEDPLNSRYYCVVLQYNSKLDAEQLRRFVRDSIPEADRPSKKKFNFQHAPGEVSEELTGFGHNGVSTFGMKTSIPVIVAGAITELRPSFLWLGGGAESVKLRISVQDLLLVSRDHLLDSLTRTFALHTSQQRAPVVYVSNEFHKMKFFATILVAAAIVTQGVAQTATNAPAATTTTTVTTPTTTTSPTVTDAPSTTTAPSVVTAAPSTAPPATTSPPSPVTPSTTAPVEPTTTTPDEASTSYEGSTDETNETTTTGSDSDASGSSDGTPNVGDTSGSSAAISGQSISLLSAASAVVASMVAALF